MEDISLVAIIDDDTTVYVCPVHDLTYSEYVDQDNLGGSSGYFIAREHKKKFEILAKAVDLNAAREIFGMLTSFARSPA